jgi:trimeric autotransporter adhesin
LTNERKKMSTKTSIKRIAAVAALALTLGGFSAVSANAANVGDSLFSAINLTQYTATPKTGSAVLINQGQTTVAHAAVADTATTTVVAYLSAFPTGGSTLVTSSYTTCADGATAPSKPTGLGGALVGQDTPKFQFTGTTGGTTAITAAKITSSSTTCSTAWSFTPSVTGAYVVTVFADTNDDGVQQNTEVSQTISITVAAAAGWSQGLSTMYIGAGTTLPAAASGAELFGATAVKASGTQVGSVLVSLKKTDGNAYAGQKVTGTISGAGYVNCGTASALSNLDSQAHYTTLIGNLTNGSARVSSVSSTAEINGYVVCNIFSDGTAGTGTLSISVTDQVSGVSTTLGTKTFTSTGNVTKLTITANYSIARAGGYDLGKFTGMGTIDGVTKIPAFTVKATDSAGNAIGSLSLSGTSSDTTVAAAPLCTEDDGSTKYSTGGKGYFNCYWTSATTSVSGKTANVGVKILDPADATNATYISATYAVSVGGKVAKEVVSTNATSYALGAAMTVTVTATDSAGNPVYDGAITPPSLTANKSIGGTISWGTTYYQGGKASTDNATSGQKTVFAPAAGGDFLLTGTGNDAASSVLTATATVLDPNANAAAKSADAATDAANEATDAANAATDAALAAADAADAATAAAQDASDAVAALSATVATLVAGLKAQITSLTNLVIKIQKKVKA